MVSISKPAGRLGGCAAGVFNYYVYTHFLAFSVAFCYYAARKDFRPVVYTLHKAESLFSSFL